jgi:hypothetical protein
MTRKTINIIYRVANIALALFILPGLFFMNSEMAQEGLAHVGLTDAVWLAHLTGFGSPLAILLIMLPKIPNRLKEWAYVGLGIIYLGAFYAHLYIGDPVAMTIMPLVTFAVLLVSYLMWHKLLVIKGETL